MRENQDLFTGVLLCAFGILTLVVLIPYGVQQPPSVQYRALSPSYWPNIVAGAITAIGLALAVSSWLSTRSKQADAATDQDGSAWLAIRPFVALAVCFALYFALDPLGFVLATTFALALLMILAGEHRPYIVLPVALLVPFGLHLFFTKAASVPIPMGILEPLLLRI